jgi:hypothetical protein
MSLLAVAVVLVGVFSAPLALSQMIDPSHIEVMSLNAQFGLSFALKNARLRATAVALSPQSLGFPGGYGSVHILGGVSREFTGTVVSSGEAFVFDPGFCSFSAGSRDTFIARQRLTLPFHRWDLASAVAQKTVDNPFALAMACGGKNTWGDNGQQDCMIANVTGGSPPTWGTHRRSLTYNSDAPSAVVVVDGLLASPTFLFYAADRTDPTGGAVTLFRPAVDHVQDLTGPLLNSWTKPAAAAIRHFGYFVGGFNHPANKPGSTLVRVDARDGTIFTRPNFLRPAVSNLYGSVVLGSGGREFFLAFGGTNENSTFVDDAHLWFESGGNLSSTSPKASSLPSAAWSSGCLFTLSHGRHVVVAGGEWAGTQRSNHITYTDGSAQAWWSLGQTLPNGTHLQACATVDLSLNCSVTVLAGGNDELATADDHVWTVTLNDEESIAAGNPAPTTAITTGTRGSTSAAGTTGASTGTAGSSTGVSGSTGSMTTTGGPQTVSSAAADSSNPLLFVWIAVATVVILLVLVAAALAARRFKASSRATSSSSSAPSANSSVGEAQYNNVENVTSDAPIYNTFDAEVAERSDEPVYNSTAGIGESEEPVYNSSIGVGESEEPVYNTFT